MKSRTYMATSPLGGCRACSRGTGAQRRLVQEQRHFLLSVGGDQDHSRRDAEGQRRENEHLGSPPRRPFRNPWDWKFTTPSPRSEGWTACRPALLAASANAGKIV